MMQLFLENRNIRSLTLFATFGGVGRGLFTMFMMWAIHAMYQNTVYTGIAGFMFGAPLAASFIVGPLVDRWNKARTLRTVEIVKFCIAALMLVSHLHFYIGAWFLFACILIFSTATMFGAPAMTAFIPRVVDKDDLVKANVALNVGGILGGLILGAVLIGMSGGELDFTRFYSVITAVLLIAVLCSLFFNHEEALANDKESALMSYWGELGEGFLFAKKGAMLFFAVAIMSMNFFSEIAYVNFPMLIDTHLGDASRFLLLSFLAMMGGLAGSFICGAAENKYRLGTIFSASFVLSGVARVIFVFMLPDNFVRAVIPYIVYVGFATTVGMLFTIIIQKISPKNLVSRVTTITTSLSFVATAVGALVGGFMGTVLDVDTMFFIQGGSYIAIGLLLYLSGSIRGLPKISELKGSEDDPDILQDEVASGL